MKRGLALSLLLVALGCSANAENPCIESVEWEVNGCPPAPCEVDENCPPGCLCDTEEFHCAPVA